MTSNPQKRNAFTALMSSASAAKSGPPPKKHKPILLGLQPFIISPETQPIGTVLYHNKDFVAIHDAFPKSTLHFLLLPRDENITLKHPFAALSGNPQFAQALRREAEGLAEICADELKRRFGGQDGRDWRREVMVGVHAHPSMANMHVHVISRDMGGVGMKKAGHYLSFQSRFFVPLDEVPLDEEGWERRWKEVKGVLHGNLKCWRCKENFGRSFAKLKAHLEMEVEAWRTGNGPEWKGHTGEDSEHGEEEEDEEQGGEEKGKTPKKVSLKDSPSTESQHVALNESQPVTMDDGSETE